MKTLNKNQWIGIFAAMALLTYLLFSGPLLSFFNPAQQEQSTQMTNESLLIDDPVVGEGDVAESGDTLTVHYVGSLPDGTVFDSSVARGFPITFTIGIGQVIRGWDEGVIGMRVGGTRVLKISPEYGYGSQGAGPIPPNSTLIFEVQLLKVEKPGGSQ
jgi:peptidylprolyl isomerase